MNWKFPYCGLKARNKTAQGNDLGEAIPFFFALKEHHKDTPSQGNLLSCVSWLIFRKMRNRKS
jgi:hypothetical protein